MLFNSLRRVPQLRGNLRASFATISEAYGKQSTESYNTFRTAYLEQTKKFTEAMNSGKSSQQQAEKSNRTRKAYKHPFHNQENAPIVMSVLDVFRSFQEMVGPEMVSPHYENFAMSRKWAIGFWVGAYGMIFLAHRPDFSHFAMSTFIPFMFYYFTFYWFLEGKKSMIKPLLFRFQQMIIDHETNLALSYWNDNMRELIHRRLEKAKEQIEYFSVHQDYHSIKAESINRFLAIEEINLKNHVQQRAQKVLAAAEQMEVANQRYLINSIVSEALSEVDKTLNENIDEIQDAMFESALTGIRKQKMEYDNDPLLPLIRKRIQGKIQKLTNLTEEEKLNLIQLNNDQMESLRVLDRQLRDEYLRKVPKLDNSIKNYPQVKKTLENWGRQGSDATK